MLLPIALWIVAVGSLVTLIQRVVTVRRESAEADAAEAAAPAAQGPAGALRPDADASGRDGEGDR